MGQQRWLVPVWQTALVSGEVLTPSYVDVLLPSASCGASQSIGLKGFQSSCKRCIPVPLHGGGILC